MRASQRPLLTWVETQIRRCRLLALRHFRSSTLRVSHKPDRSPVTIADRLIEERLRQAIERTFPGESILGEEFGFSGRPSETYWVIDPIDGTRAFSRGLPSWGIMIGRVERGRPMLGVIDYPVLGTTLAAARGVKAYERTRGRVRLLGRAQSVTTLRNAVVFHGGSHWWEATPYAKGFARLIRGCFLERAYGDCYGYLWAFRGCAHAVVDYGVKPWDLIPLAALAQATGWLLTDCAGRPSLTGPGTVMAGRSSLRLIVKTLSGGS